MIRYSFIIISMHLLVRTPGCMSCQSSHNTILHTLSMSKLSFDVEYHHITKGVILSAKTKGKNKESVCQGFYICYRGKHLFQRFSHLKFSLQSMLSKK